MSRSDTTTPSHHPHHPGAAGERRFVGAVIALVTLVAGLALPASGPVLAAASLTATPNPVPIAYGQTTGTFVLSWDSGSRDDIELVLARSGQPPDPPVQKPAAGSMDVPIELGEIVTVTMQPVGGGAPLTRPLTVTAVASPPPDVIDCTAAQCAYEETATPHGTWATINVQIADVKDVVVEVTDPDGKIVATTPMTINGSSATADVLGLEAQTKYDYVISVLDNLGNTTDEVSSVFVTLDRVIDLTFTTFTLLDDSDDLTDAELDLWFTVGSVDWTRWNGARLSWGTGHVEDLGITTSVVQAEAVMPFAFFVEDDDKDITSGLCSAGPQLGTTDEDACYSWITVGASVDTTGNTGANEDFSTSFVLLGVNDDDLAFSVGYEATVTYK